MTTTLRTISLPKRVLEAGEFSIAVPEGDDPVALELLVDINGDGLPSASEYFAVIEMAGQLIPDKSRTDLNLDSTKRDFFTPAPDSRYARSSIN